MFIWECSSWSVIWILPSNSNCAQFVFWSSHATRIEICRQWPAMRAMQCNACSCIWFAWNPYPNRVNLKQISSPRYLPTYCYGDIQLATFLEGLNRERDLQIILASLPLNPRSASHPHFHVLLTHPFASPGEGPPPAAIHFGDIRIRIVRSWPRH
jgi:hypothetical protein